MKFSLYKDFGAKNSPPIFEAFDQGLRQNGHHVCYHDDDADVAVIWSVLWKGSMAKNYAVWQQYRHSNRPVVVLEVGAIMREKFWRIGVNGIGLDSRFYPSGQTHHRAVEVNLPLLMNVPRGQHILITLQQTTSLLWQDMPPVEQWLSETVAKIRQHSERKIIVRPHPREKVNVLDHSVSVQMPVMIQGTYDDFDLCDKINQSWCVVNWSSNPGVIAAALGQTVFVGPNSQAAEIGDWNLADIDTRTPVRGRERLQWVSDLAYTEWTQQEISQGIMIPALVSRLESL